MAIISKSAQVLLDQELTSYRNKIIERASVYAEHDGDSLIGEKQMKLAIRDSGIKELGDVRYVEAKRRKKRVSVILWLLLLLSLIWFSICIIYLEKDSTEQGVLIVGSIASGLSIASLFLLMYSTRRRSGNGRADSVVAFLSEWNEFESLLNYSYKGANKGGNIPLTDLIQYYIQNISDDKEYDELRIVKLLKIRNSLVHRGINSFDEKILIRYTLELQDLIKKLKSK